MFKKINWKQPKYLLPAIIFLPLLFIGYQVCSLFSDSGDDTEQAVVTEGINTDLPEINQEKTKIKGKYASMLEGFGKVQDYTGVDVVEKEEETSLVDVQAVYDDAEKRRIDSLNNINQLKAEELRERMERERAKRNRKQNEFDDDQRIRERQREMDQLEKQMRMIQQVANGEKIMTEEEKAAERRAALLRERELEEQKRRQDSVRLAEAPRTVTKAGMSGEEYFNTITADEPQPNLIKARIDELVKVKDGSRIRIRLSEDVEIDGEILRKGSYLYAMVTGFTAQRVNARVSSILLGGSIKKVSLKVYDMDCMEGLYVPSSNFRDFSKDVGSAATSGVNINTNTTGNQSVESVAMQALQQAMTSTTSAISNQIRKNKAKIKFNTEIYLVDDSKR